MARFPLKSLVLPAALALGAATVLSACQTDVAGVETNLRSQWTTVVADVETATAAAEEVLEDLKLIDVTSTSTGIDGRATAKTAEETEITVSVAKVVAGSQITVTVGTVGNNELGKAILADIQAKLAAAE
ncbi:MAG: DUF3568 family protein [Planctomycetota bacterium]